MKPRITLAVLFLISLFVLVDFALAECSGWVELTLTPSTTSACGVVTPSVSGISGCSGTVYFTEGSGCPNPDPSIGRPVVSYCTVSGSGCTGSNFTAPSSGGSYYTVCFDKNKDGNYEYIKQEMDWAILEVTAPSCNTQVTVSVSQETINPGETITISGRVTSAAAYNDPAVYLYLDGDQIDTVSTDSQGDYTYSYPTVSISAGSHTIKAVSTIDCCSEGNATDDFNVVIPPSQYGNLNVRITDCSTSLPISDARVDAYRSDDPSEYTDSDGYVTFTDLPIGQYTVTASASGYTSNSTTETVSCSQTTYASICLSQVVPSPVCRRQTPTISITPSSQTGAAGSTLSYTVTVANNDNSACASSAFSFTSNCPSVLSCSFDNNNLAIAPGSSGSTVMRVASLQNATGNNSFSVTATYPYGSVSGSGTYVVSQPSTCGYSLSISPSSGSYSGSSNRWYISATDFSSSGCPSNLTYIISYSTSGDCDSPSVSSNTFAIPRGSTLSEAFNIVVRGRTNSCTLSLSIISPSGSTVASGSYSVNPSSGGCASCPCSERFLDEYRCSDNWRQQRYKYSDCSTTWKNIEYCSYGCSSGSCEYSYGPYYTYYSAPIVVEKPAEKMEVATVPAGSPYEGEIPKVEVYSQTKTSTPWEGTVIVAILILLLLLLLLGIFALLRRKGRFGEGAEKAGSEGRGQREGFIESKKETKVESSKNGNFFLWCERKFGKNTRDHAECIGGGC